MSINSTKFNPLDIRYLNAIMLMNMGVVVGYNHPDEDSDKQYRFRTFKMPNGPLITQRSVLGKDWEYFAPGCALPYAPPVFNPELNKGTYFITDKMNQNVFDMILRIASVKDTNVDLEFYNYDQVLNDAGVSYKVFPSLLTDDSTYFVVEEGERFYLYRDSVSDPDSYLPVSMDEVQNIDDIQVSLKMTIGSGVDQVSTRSLSFF